MPRPRKLKPASAMMDDAIPAVDKTMIGPIALGRICLNMVRIDPYPKALVASTYSISRSEKLSANNAGNFNPAGNTDGNECLPKWIQCQAHDIIGEFQ